MDPKAAQEKFAEARNLSMQKEFERSLHLLDELETAFPNAQEILHLKALCLARLQRKYDALLMCDRLIEEFQDDRAQFLKDELLGRHTLSARARETCSGYVTALSRFLPLQSDDPRLLGTVALLAVLIFAGVLASLYMPAKRPTSPTSGKDRTRTALPSSARAQDPIPVLREGKVYDLVNPEEVAQFRETALDIVRQQQQYDMAVRNYEKSKNEIREFTHIHFRGVIKSETIEYKDIDSATVTTYTDVYGNMGRKEEKRSGNKIVIRFYDKYDRPMRRLELVDPPPPPSNFPDLSFSEAAIPALAGLVRDYEQCVGEAAINALEGMIPEGRAALVQTLVELLGDREMRLAAFWKLVSLRTFSTAEQGWISGMRIATPEQQLSAVPHLAAFLQEEGLATDDKFVVEVLKGISDIGPPAEAAVPVLIQLLRDGRCLGETAETLGRIGPGAAAAVPYLVTTMRDRGFDVRSMDALAKIGVPAVRGLTEYLNDHLYAMASRPLPNNYAEHLSVAIESIGLEAVPVLIELLQNENTALGAADALARFGPRAETAVPALQAMKKSKNRLERDYAGKALKSIAPNLLLAP